ncbi:hypothetical protein [Rhodococcus koreensis]|uniref:hypothetical protein n=1 Tax=Rhodococcus koreensis TaxID=99653 RepID=UPI0036DC9FFD
MTDTVIETGLSAENAAHRRAMPTTRLLDGGMLHADVILLEQAIVAGDRWDVAAERLGEHRL